MNISTEAKKEIRSLALRKERGSSSAPIVVEDSSAAPYWVGDSFHYENKSGDRIRYPNAYRRAWGKPIYVKSTRRIMVGKEWLKQLEIDLIQVKLSRRRGKLVRRDLAKFVFYFD
jgi:hypothetical protein